MSNIRLRSPEVARTRSLPSPRKTKWLHLWILRGVWLLLVFYAEYLTFLLAVHSANWPAVDGITNVTKLLIVTDPQIPDHRSYADRGSLLSWLSQQIILNYARKSWRLVISHLKPDTIVFLGDLLDSGVQTTDRLEHAHYVEKFKSTFPIEEISSIIVPGNHDLGLYQSKIPTEHAQDHFMDAFGPLNGVVIVGNHSLIYVNSMGLLDEKREAGPNFGTPSHAQSNSTWKFVYDLAKTSNSLPSILLTHIPLFRPHSTPCGPLREKWTPIEQGGGLNYQNLLDEQSTKLLLEYTQPSIVFSGDDHDFCQVKHPIQSPASWTLEVTEITIKAFSMAMGISRPGYQLVSLHNPDNEHRSPQQATLATEPGFLPNQIALYHWIYLVPFVITLMYIVFPKIYKQSITKKSHSSKSKAKHNHIKTYSKGYNHARALSRQSLYSDSEASSGDEDFRYEKRQDYGYSYYPSGDEDGLPTPVTTSVFSNRRPERVRRVSRVYLWDGSKRDDDIHSRGLVSKYVRPIFHLSSRAWHSIFAPTIGRWYYRLGLDAILWQSARQLWSIAWPSLTIFSLIWFRFML